MMLDFEPEPDAYREHEVLALAGMIGQPDRIGDWRDILSPDRFYYYPHRVVCETLYAMFDRGEYVDSSTVWTELGKRGHGEDVGVELMGYLASAGGTEIYPHAQRVIESANSRSFAAALQEGMASLKAREGPADELILRHQQQLDQLLQRNVCGDGVRLPDSISQVLDDIDARRRGDRPACLATGFPCLDDFLCGGLGNGHLTVLAARTSVGKTSLALNIATNVCRAGGSVYFASLEQEDKELTERILGSLSKVSGRRIRSGELDSQHVESLLKAAGQARDWKWVTDYRQSPRADQILAAARRNARRLGGLSLVVVDYLTRIRPDDPRAPRYQQTGAAVRRLQDLARSMHVPVLLLAQLNREAADGERPALHHIRESGDVEQDADAVLLLHQEAIHGRLTDNFRLIVGKQRNGPKGEVRLIRDDTTYEFREDEFPEG